MTTLSPPFSQRGYYGIGVEGVSKPMNFGNLARTAYGFGASFVFTVSPATHFESPQSDTTKSGDHMPWYSYETLEDFVLPHRCQLVGVELVPEARYLPHFKHPTQAAYILGPEGGSLSDEMLECCAHIVRIPTRFCLNVATAGAIVMYDRLLSLGKFSSRPLHVGGSVESVPPLVHGKPVYSGNRRQDV